MLKKSIFIILLLLLMLTLASLAQAQTTGTVRGTAYQDTNADGVCVGTGEQGLEGVPIQLVSADGQTTVNLATGTDGTYGMVAAGFGTWNVTAVPGEGFRVTSQQTRQVFISTTNPEVTGADFCVATVSSSTGGTVTVMPETGTTLPNGLLGIATVGLAFIMIGLGLEIRRRLAS